MPLDHLDLREMKKSGDIEGLLSVLDTGDPKEIGDAIRILGELRSRKAIRPLIAFLEKDDIQIRANCAWALGEIGEVKAVLPLIGLLNDPSENVRVYAAWALGKIGDKRAISALNAALRDGSPDLRRHIKEAIVKIESKGHKRQKGDDDTEDGGSGETSEKMDIPLVTLDVPLGVFECDYVSKVEGESKKGATMGFSGDVSIQDTVNANQENTRRIVIGLKEEFHGLVSVDVLFKYIDNDGGEKTSSVWLQMETIREGSRPEIESEEEPRIRASHQVFRKARIKQGRKQSYKPVEPQIPEEEEPEILEPEDYTEQKAARKREVPGRKRAVQQEEEPEIQELQDAPEDYTETAAETSESMEEAEVEKEHLTPQQPEKPQAPPQQPVQEIQQQPVVERPQAPPQQPVQEVQQQPVVERPQAPPQQPVQEVQQQVVEKPQAPPQPEKAAEPPVSSTGNTGASVDSAVRLLSDIGMSGMTEAASAVTQLGGQEAESLQARLRTLPVDQIPDELTTLGDYIASVEVKLHGKGEAGEMKGEMQMYFPKNVALDIANELLCIPQNAAVKEFTDDIISTLKETANIFGGQYVSAISEYIEIPIYLEAPGFRTGTSAQIAESLMKEISGKIEFVLSTDLAFGNGKSGRLIMLLDPKSYDIIITKLF